MLLKKKEKTTEEEEKKSRIKIYIYICGRKIIKWDNLREGVFNYNGNKRWQRMQRQRQVGTEEWKVFQE